MNRNPWRNILLVALTGALALLATETWGERRTVLDQLDLLVDVRHEIVSEYVEEPDEQAMVEAAARAMVDSLDDRHSVYLSPEDLEPFDKQVRGSFSGIGAEIDVDPGTNRVRIVSPLEDCPAWHAGVLAGDIILTIDEADTTDMDINEAVDRLTGPEGTDVVIHVRHFSGEEQTISITRAQINVPTVRGWRRIADLKHDFMLDDEDRIGYIRVTQFTEHTIKQLQDALDQLRDQQVRGLILDLRFDPGGMLEAAVAVSDMFLPAGHTIVSIKGRTTPQRIFRSSGRDDFLPIPIVVLANELSASASEIVTGALADNGRALFIGTRTFGKGSVQQVKMLPSGQGAVKITNAYYYLPSGRNINRKPEGKDSGVDPELHNVDKWGVDPNDGFYVPMTFDQNRDMMEVRRAMLGPENTIPENPVVTPEWIKSELKDIQLAAALTAMLGKLETDQWPIVGESGADELVRAAERETLQRQREQLEEVLGEIDQKIAKLDAGEPIALEGEQKSDETAEPKTEAAQEDAGESAEQAIVPDGAQLERAPAVPDTQPAE